jgi:hypothetical protein
MHWIGHCKGDKTPPFRISKTGIMRRMNLVGRLCIMNPAMRVSPPAALSRFTRQEMYAYRAGVLCLWRTRQNQNCLKRFVARIQPGSCGHMGCTSTACADKIQSRPGTAAGPQTKPLIGTHQEHATGLFHMSLGVLLRPHQPHRPHHPHQLGRIGVGAKCCQGQSAAHNARARPWPPCERGRRQEAQAAATGRCARCHRTLRTRQPPATGCRLRASRCRPSRMQRAPLRALLR